MSVSQSYSISREFEFLELLKTALPRILNADVISQPTLANRWRPDFIAHLPSGEDAIIEAKMINPNTHSRLTDAVRQIQNYSEVYQQEYPHNPRPSLMLAVPGTFSDNNLAFLHENGIDRIIDGPALKEAGVDVKWAAAQTAHAEPQASIPRRNARLLLRRLDDVAPGKASWSAYQALCGDILSFLLCPPLEQPITESSNLSKVNRRDLVLPNYATGGFWEYMRSYYEAHYIVVDAKNYVGNVKKKEILQLANYLSIHATGLFGSIISRSGGDKSAEVTRREQWVMHRKMVLILNDDDMRQMISLRAAGNDPADLIRQKIEDFRLCF